MLMIEKPDPIQQRHPDPLEAPSCLLACLPQLELYQKNEGQIRKGGLLFLLPKVIILNILQQLDFKNYANIFRVCKQWKQLRDPLFKQLYNQLCKRNREIYGDLYQDVPEILKDLSFLKLFQTKLKIRREYNNVALNIKYRCHESQYYYEGKFDFYMNGKGICYYKNGSKYEGKFSYNARDGFGKYYWKNGDFYEGEWKSNKRNGQGTFKWKNGSEYTGDWKNNQREGKGKYIGKSKNVYEGEFKNSEKHGYGVYRFINGDVYEGDFVDGKRSGKGKYVWKNGDVYVGDYLNKKRTGKGEMIYSSGDHYIGDFVDNLFDGQGVYTWKSGEVFEGRFVKGKMIREKKNGVDAIQNSPPKEGEEDVNNHKKCQIF